ncbi:MAG: ABC transporter substrate-binding protein [Thermoleophilia bacterium]|nr:ABC transporter substrate-binding protein [Thermoleophilia bacterium]
MIRRIPTGARRRPRVARAVLAAAGLLVPAAAHAAAPAGTLVVEAHGNPDFLDPALAFSPQSWQILVNTGSGLMAFRREPGARGAEVVPDLAAAPPQVSDEGRVYAFTLRPDARFGAPLDRPVLPSDVKASLERLFLIDSRGASLYRGIVGAKDMAEGRADTLRGVAADDASRRLVIRIAAADPAFPAALAMPFAFVMPRGTPPVDQSTRPPVATGPYAIARYEPDRRIELVRNPDYSPRGEALPAGVADRILVQLGTPARDAAVRVADGEADYMQAAVSPAWTTGSGPAVGAQVRRTPAAATWHLSMDAAGRPFADPRVRRALALVLEPRRAAALLGSPAIPTAQLLPPVSPAFVRRPVRARADLAAARALVRAARARGTRVTVWYRPGRGQRDVAVLTAGLLSRIGLPSAARALPASSGLPAVTAAVPGRVLVGVARWDQVLPDPSDAFGWLTGAPSLGTPAAPMPAPAADAVLRRAAARSAAQPVGAARWRAYADMDRLVTDRVALLPFATPVRVEITSPRLRGWVAHPVYGFLWMRATLGD